MAAAKKNSTKKVGTVEETNTPQEVMGDNVNTVETPQDKKDDVLEELSEIVKVDETVEKVIDSMQADTEKINNTIINDPEKASEILTEKLKEIETAETLLEKNIKEAESQISEQRKKKINHRISPTFFKRGSYWNGVSDGWNN